MSFGLLAAPLLGALPSIVMSTVVCQVPLSSPPLAS
jgi:hypothetical protein